MTVHLGLSLASSNGRLNCIGTKAFSNDVQQHSIKTIQIVHSLLALSTCIVCACTRRADLPVVAATWECLGQMSLAQQGLRQALHAAGITFGNKFTFFILITAACGAKACQLALQHCKSGIMATICFSSTGAPHQQSLLPSSLSAGCLGSAEQMNAATPLLLYLHAC